MNNDQLIEMRNKAIQFYQLASMVEYGGIDLEKCLEQIKNTSKSLIEILDKAIEEDSMKFYGDVINDPLYDSIYDPIEVNPQMLSKIKNYLEFPKNKKKDENFF